MEWENIITGRKSVPIPPGCAARKRKRRTARITVPSQVATFLGEKAVFLRKC